jgi:cytochrome c-type biogenesis protein
MIPQTFSKFNIILLSIIFGIAAFFSPCAFTVLPAYVSNYLTKKEEKEKPKLSKLLKLGLFAALGIIVVNMVIGTAIAILGSATPFAKDPRQDIPLILAIRTIAGFFIAFLGLMTLMHKSFNIGFIQNFLSKKEFSKSMFGYGIIYNAAAIGCTGPIMLGLMIYAYSTGSFISALTSFLIFSLTMGILMILLTVLIGLFKSIIIKKMVQVTPIIMKTAGVIMIIVGLSIAILTLEGNKIFVKIFFPFLE